MKILNCYGNKDNAHADDDEETAYSKKPKKRDKDAGWSIAPLE